MVRRIALDPTALDVWLHPPGNVRVFFGKVSSHASRASVLDIVASTVSNIETTMLATEGLEGALTIPWIG